MAAVQPSAQRTYSIGELAAEFALTPRTIRFYEDCGLLAPARDGVNRVYGYRDRVRLQLICRGKRLGFSLAEIKDFLDLYEAGDGQLSQMRFVLDKARARIRALERQRADLDQTLAELRGIEAAIVEHLRHHGLEPSAQEGPPCETS